MPSPDMPTFREIKGDDCTIAAAASWQFLKTSSPAIGAPSTAARRSVFQASVHNMPGKDTSGRRHEKDRSPNFDFGGAADDYNRLVGQ
jgi:hypothetical protein